MRLWHKSLIPYLPDLQLKGQWRECAMIADALAKNGTPNHLLVNNVTKYDPQEFGVYCQKVYDEMQRRKFNPSFDKMVRILSDVITWDLKVDAISSNFHFICLLINIRCCPPVSIYYHTPAYLSTTFL